MLRKPDKEKIVEKLQEEFKEAKSIVFTDYKGISAAEAREIRKSLLAQNISYGVYKKSLIQLALEKIGIKADVRSYKGPLSLSISKEDEILPAKAAADFSKKNENFKIVGGVLENNYLESEAVNNLAKLPGKNELIAKAVGSIKAPISNFVSVMGGVTRQFVGVLRAIEEKKGADN